MSKKKFKNKTDWVISKAKESVLHKIYVPESLRKYIPADPQTGKMIINKQT